MKYFKNCLTLDEAKAQYKKLVFQLHPDKGGDTATFQDMQNEFEAFQPGSLKYENEMKDHVPAEFMHIINELVNLPCITIEVCGNWIWLSGDTKPVKDQIKSIETGDSYRRGWSKNKSQWYFSPRGYRKRSKKSLSIDEIRDLYGSHTVKANKKQYITQ